MPCVFRKLLKYAVLSAVNANIVMTTAADQLKGMYHIDVHNISIGRYSLAFPQARCLKLYVWMVRTVTFLARPLSSADSAMVVSCGMVWSLLLPLQFAFLIGLPYNVAECSYLEALLSMSQGHVNPRDHQRVMDAQWQLTQQTYGLYRPSRDGFLQIFRAVSSYIGPGNPAILSVPVSAQDSPDFFLNLIEQSWNDLRIPGAVVPWQLFPIDSTRPQSSQRALAYPSYIMVTHDDFASFEQRPHGLMEVIIPGDSWLFGTVLPWRVNWSILREFIAPWCPLGLVMDRIEFLLSGTLLTEQIVECWHGFYARVILTYRGSPPPMMLPFRQLWAPLPHLQHSIIGDQVYRHVVYVPGGTSLLFSSLFDALGRETQWVQLATWCAAGICPSPSTLCAPVRGSMKQSAWRCRFVPVTRSTLPLSLHYLLHIFPWSLWSRYPSRPLCKLVQSSARTTSAVLACFSSLDLLISAPLMAMSPVYATRMECPSVTILFLQIMLTLFPVTKDGVMQLMMMMLSSSRILKLR